MSEYSVFFMNSATTKSEYTKNTANRVALHVFTNEVSSMSIYPHLLRIVSIFPVLAFAMLGLSIPASGQG